MYQRKINTTTIVTAIIWLVSVSMLLTPNFQTKNTLFSQANAYHSIQVVNT
jgi:hypothetical protein